MKLVGSISLGQSFKGLPLKEDVELGFNEYAQILTILAYCHIIMIPLSDQSASCVSSSAP